MMTNILIPMNYSFYFINGTQNHLAGLKYAFVEVWSWTHYSCADHIAYAQYMSQLTISCV
jgi:hypothetical protein